jgi:hypothetical protein
MTDIDIDAARALCDAATPGPWVWFGDLSIGNMYLSAGRKREVLWPSGMHTEGYLDVAPEDAAFIAAARDLVPALLAEVERLRDQVIATPREQPHRRSIPVLSALRAMEQAVAEVERLRGTVAVLEGLNRTLAAECASATSRALDYKAERDEAQDALARVKALRGWIATRNVDMTAESIVAGIDTALRGES